jgi:cardiolipin synthase
MTDEGLDRVLTVPNLVTVSRLVLLGLFCFLLFGAGQRVAASIVLMVTGMTDFLDGYLARRYHQVTTLGKVLDPSVDRLVVVTAVISIAVYGAVPVWLAAVVLGRELVVSAAMVVLAALGARRIDVVWAGKAGTFGLMCCFPVFLLADGPGAWAHALTVATWVGIVPALALSFYAAASYVPLARKALAEGRAVGGAGGGRAVEVRT